MGEDGCEAGTLRYLLGASYLIGDTMQSFSDDEEEPDMPLQPLPEIEQEANEGEDDMEADTSVAPESASRAVSEPVSAPQDPEDSTPGPTVPKPHPLSMSMLPGEDDTPDEMVIDSKALEGTNLAEGMETSISGAGLDASMNSGLDANTAGGMGGLDVGLDAGLVNEGLGEEVTDMDLQGTGLTEGLDLTQLGPDGEQFEAAGDLAQLQSTDSLLGGEAMDGSADPFNGAS